MGGGLLGEFSFECESPPPRAARSPTHPSVHRPAARPAHRAGAVSGSWSRRPVEAVHARLSTAISSGREDGWRGAGGGGGISGFPGRIPARKSAPRAARPSPRGARSGRGGGGADGNGDWLALQRLSRGTTMASLGVRFAETESMHVESKENPRIQQFEQFLNLL
eukprot:gene16880-biopygen23306